MNAAQAPAPPCPSSSTPSSPFQLHPTGLAQKLEGWRSDLPEAEGPAPFPPGQALLWEGLDPRGNLVSGNHGS